MLITRIGTDYISINEDNVNKGRAESSPKSKVHLIKLNFFSPTTEKIEKVLNFYPDTNRFVIDNNIRIYNGYLKHTTKKYYVENKEGTGLITFFRKNNKVLLNVENLTSAERQFVLSSALVDILKNIEVILMDQEDFENCKEILEPWNGNVILFDPNFII